MGWYQGANGRGQVRGGQVPQPRDEVGHIRTLPDETLPFHLSLLDLTL
jgi:hypothetical protein